MRRTNTQIVEAVEEAFGVPRHLLRVGGQERGYPEAGRVMVRCVTDGRRWRASVVGELRIEEVKS